MQDGFKPILYRGNHMRTIISGFIALLLFVPVSWAQNSPSATPAPAAQKEDPAQLQKEIDQLKSALNSLEQRLAVQEKQAQALQSSSKDTSKSDDLTVSVDDLDKRVSEAEKHQALDRIQFTGDYRFEAHSIWGNVPAHFDGMAMQNLMVKTLFMTTPTSQGGLGMPFSPSMMSMPIGQFANTVNGAVMNNYSQYQFFTSNLTFDRLNQAAQQFKQMGILNPFMGYLAGAPGVFVPGYSDNNDILYTNRLRLKFNAKVADNISFEGRLSMYKVFGDSTGVQVFNGQPNTLAIDGTTVGVPNSDIVRVERAYFSWNDIGGSKFYLSIGRRPSTYGPPLNYRQDEPRGGTPSGAIIDYQFDGITLGYRLNENMIWRLCYGLGYDSGWGNGNMLVLPQDRLKDVHFLGGNLDLWTTDKSLVQLTLAHAWNVTDGFPGLVVMPFNPLTGDPNSSNTIMRYTPSANLGSINLASVNVTRRQGPVDLYLSGNYSGTRPNGLTTPFGGLMSNPFDTPQDRNGFMVLAGIRYNFGSDERTKLGFEMNHGTKYWFNFAQAEDDIIAPKTNTRGEVYEVYLTHEFTPRFILKLDGIRYNYRWSGSGWDVGAPMPLDAGPQIMGFPTYKDAFMATAGLTVRF